MAFPARRLDAYPEYAQPQRPFKTREHLEVVRGTKHQSSTQTQLNFALAARVALAALLLIGVIGFVRISLISATVQISLSSSEIAQNLKDTRFLSTNLEVKQAGIANPQVIRQKAQALGMSAPQELIHMSMPEDTLAYTSDGKLSLTESIKRAAAEG